MIRFVVILLAMAGSAFILSRLFPQMGSVAFILPLISVSVSWLMLAAVGVGGIAYKVTK